MKLFEFEGKALLSRYGIEVPRSRMAEDSAPLPYPFVLKAQTLSGGRGKAGGVRLCENQEAFETNRQEIMDLTIQGHPVHGLLAEEAVSIQRELYIALTLQGVSRPKLIACASGGMEIETLAKTAPEQILNMEIDPLDGLSGEDLQRIASFLHLPEESGILSLLKNLQTCFFDTDALLVEINPLGLVEGRVVALDAKVELDDHAAYRHPEEFRQLEEGRSALKAYQAAEDDGTTITFVPLDGDIGLISDGAGTGMLTLDMLHDLGGKTASFCELGGTTPASTMYKALEYTMSTGRPLKSLLVVLIGGFNRMDDMANGIVGYHRDHPLQIPIFVRMVGNMEEAGKEIMAAAGFSTFDNLTEAASAAVAAAKR